MEAWLLGHRALLAGLGVASLAMLIGTLLLVPFLVVRLPPDYFYVRHRHRLRPFAQHGRWGIVLLVGKNLLGVVFVLLGVGMLVLPGQGVLTLLLGVVMLDFPGKFRLERFIVSRRSVYRGLNWLRRRAKKPRLLLPPRAHRLRR